MAFLSLSLYLCIRSYMYDEVMHENLWVRLINRFV